MFVGITAITTEKERRKDFHPFWRKPIFILDLWYRTDYVGHRVATRNTYKKLQQALKALEEAIAKPLVPRSIMIVRRTRMLVAITEACVV